MQNAGGLGKPPAYVGEKSAHRVEDRAASARLRAGRAAADVRKTADLNTVRMTVSDPLLHVFACISRP